MEKQECTEPEAEFVQPRDGKDELNLAEFPLCAIGDRLDPHQKTLVFEDSIWDATRGERIPRQLTITGSDAYGLPTALDDAVLLGLIQLSKQHQFADRRVAFTRYQLLQVLGWRDEGKTYERLEQSLNRWTGVTLYYQNAWWNKADQCWVNEKLHVLDNVSLVKAPRRSRKRPPRQPLLMSSFVWNDVVFRSFQAGNLKSLDFAFYQSLKSAVARRLYRFLDKRFFRRRHWAFNVRELAQEHIGLARSYDVANLKRKLRPAIHELEQRAFLTPMTVEEASALLHAAWAHPELELGWWVTLGLFCGVRVAELERLSASAVDLERGFVHIGAEVAKRRRVRNIDFAVDTYEDASIVGADGTLRVERRAVQLDSVSRWLAACPPPKTGRVCPDKFRSKWLRLLEICGWTRHEPKSWRWTFLRPWPANGMRHTYASMFYELTGNAALVSSRLGHHGADAALLFEHYRGMTKHGDGHRFFSLHPPASNIVAILAKP